MAKEKSKAARRMYAMGRGAGLKSTGVAAGVGAVTGAVAGMLAEHVEFMRKAWYITPLAAIGGGHAIKVMGGQKARDAANAVIGAGGAMAYFNYKLAKASETSGLQEVGALETDYLGAFNQLPEAGGVQEPMGSRAPSSVMGLQT